MTQPPASHPPSPKRQVAQLVLEAKDIDLETWLKEQRHDEGHSLEQIARDLYVLTDLQVSVTIQTVGRWLEDIALEEAAS